MFNIILYLKPHLLQQVQPGSYAESFFNVGVLILDAGHDTTPALKGRLGGWGGGVGGGTTTIPFSFLKINANFLFTW